MKGQTFPENVCLSPSEHLYQNTTDRVAYKSLKSIAHSPEGWQVQGQGAVRTLSVVCPHVIEGSRDLCGSLLDATNPIHEDSTLMTEAPPT